MNQRPDPIDLFGFRAYLEARMADYDPALRESYLTNHLSGVARGEDILDDLRALTRLEGRALIDLGCGDAAALAAFAHSELGTAIGIDYSADAIEGARALAASTGLPLRMARADGMCLPFADDRFDLAVSSDVLEHIPDPERYLAEAARVLRPGGLLYLSTTSRYSPATCLADPHVQLAGVSLLPEVLQDPYVSARGRTWDVAHYFTAPELRDLLRRHGFRMRFAHRGRLAKKLDGGHINNPTQRLLLGWLTRSSTLKGLVLGICDVFPALLPTMIIVGHLEKPRPRDP